MTLRLALALVVALGATSFAARAAEPIQLKFATIGGPGNLWYKGVETWSANVQKDSGGLLEIQVYPGGTIADFRTVYDRLLNGVADIAFGNFSVIADQYPKTQVTTLPFMPGGSTASSLATWKIYTRGVIADEFARQKPLALFTFGPTSLHFVRSIKSVDELKGVKILTTSRTAGKIVDLLGATPISSTSGELYQSLSRGVAEGVASTTSGVEVFKIDGIVKHHIEESLGQGLGYFFFNKASYERLPEKARQAVDRESGEPASERMGKIADDEDKRVRAKFTAGNGQVIEKVSPAEIERMRKLAEPLIQEWVKETPNGAAVLAAYRAALQEVGATK